MIIIECEQGTPEWHEARRGIPTSSEFQTLLMKGRDGKSPSLTRAKYVRQLAGEILTGEVCEDFTNKHMERGKVMEQEARDWYEFHTDNVVERIGFAYSQEHNAGFSSDGLVCGRRGGLEIKTKLPHLHLELLEDGVLPTEHKAQCQGAIWLGGLEFMDFVSYWPKLPPFLIRVEPDPPYIEALSAAVASFNAELKTYVNRFAFQAAEAA